MNYRHLLIIATTSLTVLPAASFAQEQKAPDPKQETVENPAAPAEPTPAETPAAGDTATQTPPEYLDNRSTPQSLIESYYNAINRQEYARAYGYYATENQPQPFPQFQAGYEKTASVVVKLGKPEGEGAAGSAYWSVPLAIQSKAEDGTTTVYNGCYRLRLANPAIQGVPYVPLSLLDGTLQKSEKSLEESVPDGCVAP